MAAQVTEKTWDPFKSYNLTEDEKRLLERRKDMRASLKAEWQKKVSNPHRGMHGYIHDPQITHQYAMRSTYWHQFKATPRTSWHGLLFGVIPFITITYFYTADRKKREKLIRTGQVKYADRDFKHI